MWAFLSIKLLLFTLLVEFSNAAQDPRLKTALTLQHPVNGVATTPDGRIFIVYARVDGSTGPQVAEWNNGHPKAYPNAEWNSYAPGKDAATHLVRTNAIRIGPDGALWIVDVGSPSFNAPTILPGGPKLVQVNVTTNKVQRVYHLDNVALSSTYVDDIRFNPATGMAYLTDAGVPAIIVMNLATGEGRRVLEYDKTTAGYMPISAEGKLLHGPNGSYQYIFADQCEVSPDGKYYYYQPCSGGMARIETKYLDAAFCNSSMASVLAQFPEPYALTPSTGGTAIDAQGNIYSSDTDRQEIIKIAPNGTWTTFIRDERLLWVDAMWVSSNGTLWMPAAQLNRGTPFNYGKSYVQKPLYVYTIDIGIGPSPIDHA